MTNIVDNITGGILALTTETILATWETTNTGSDNVTLMMNDLNGSTSASMISITSTTTTTPSTTTTTTITISQNDSMSMPGPHGIPNPMTSKGNNWGPLSLITIPILTVLTNIFLLVAIRLDRSLHQLTYYFISSMAIMHCLLAATIMPPTILENIDGSFQQSEEMCKLWITLDFFYCNNTFLHLAFANMDCFLRLKDPLRHGRITTTCSVVLWIGASWMISSVQGIAQFMLSQGDHGVIKQGVCIIADKNFVILGTLFSFLIPTIITILFHCLCVLEIRALKRGKFTDECANSVMDDGKYSSHESIPDDISVSTSSESDKSPERPPREQVQLAVVTNMTKEEDINNALVNKSPKANVSEETTTFCEDPNANHQNSIENPYSSFADHILSVDLQTSSCTLLLRDPTIENLPSELCVRKNAENDHSSPDENFRHEQLITKLMFVVVVISIGLWMPFSVSNVVYGVCQSCRDRMTFQEMNVFKWLAYSVSLLSPFLFVKFNEPLWNACCRVFACKCCRKK